MRELLNNNLKRLKLKSRAINEIILLFTYCIFLVLSIKNDNLFLKEITLGGLIIIFAMISSINKKNNK